MTDNSNPTVSSSSINGNNTSTTMTSSNHDLLSTSLPQPTVLQKRVKRLTAVFLGLSLIQTVLHFNLISLAWSIFLFMSYKSIEKRPNVRVLRYFSCLNCCTAVLTLIALITLSAIFFPAITCSCDDECVDNAYLWAQDSRQWILNHSDSFHTPEWSHPLLNHTLEPHGDNHHPDDVSPAPVRHLATSIGRYLFEQEQEKEERLMRDKLYHKSDVSHDNRDEDDEWKHKYGKNQLKKNKHDDDYYAEDEDNEEDDDDNKHAPRDPGAALLVSLAHGFGNITLGTFRNRAEKVCNVGKPVSVVTFFFMLGSFVLHLIAWSSSKKLYKHPWMIAADAQRRLQRHNNNGNGNVPINTSTVPIPALSSNPQELLYRFVPGSGFVPVHMTSSNSNNGNNDVVVPMPTAPVVHHSAPVVQQQRYHASFSEPTSVAPSPVPPTTVYNTTAFEDLKDSLSTSMQPVTQLFSGIFRQRRGYQPVTMDSTSSASEFEMTSPNPRYHDHVNTPSVTTPMPTTISTTTTNTTVTNTAPALSIPTTVNPMMGSAPSFVFTPPPTNPVGSAGSYNGY